MSSNGGADGSAMAMGCTLGSMFICAALIEQQTDVKETELDTSIYRYEIKKGKKDRIPTYQNIRNAIVHSRMELDATDPFILKDSNNGEDHWLEIEVADINTMLKDIIKKITTSLSKT